ncbi:MAG: DUF721 domain-containing protein [Phycisphaerae bacterium]
MQYESLQNKTDDADNNKLGSALADYLKYKIEPKRKQWMVLSEIWGDVIPEKLKEYCEMGDLEGGVLTVKVDSQAYANEIRLISRDLMNNIRNKTGILKITKIRTELRQGR